jgi:hypothetical protein
MVDRLRALVPRLRANSAVQGHPSIRGGAHVPAYSLRIRTYFYLLSLLVRGSLLPKHDRAAACLLFSRQLVGVPNLQGYINWLNSV